MNLHLPYSQMVLIQSHIRIMQFHCWCNFNKNKDEEAKMKTDRMLVELIAQVQIRWKKTVS